MEIAVLLPVVPLSVLRIESRLVDRRNCGLKPEVVLDSFLNQVKVEQHPQSGPSKRVLTPAAKAAKHRRARDKKLRETLCWWIERKRHGRRRVVLARVSNNSVGCVGCKGHKVGTEFSNKIINVLDLVFGGLFSKDSDPGYHAVPLRSCAGLDNDPLLSCCPS